MAEGHRKLFEQHSEDLRYVCPEAEDAFVCPICFTVFLAENLDDDLKQQRLGYGHIWPKRVKKTIRWAKPKKVLLCKNCNSKAGDQGDAMVNLFEQIKEGEKTGKLPGERLIQIITTSGKKPIEIRAEVTEKPEDKGKRYNAQLILSSNINNPEDLKRLDEFLKQGGDSDVIISPHPRANVPVGQVGILTSAYLLAFCTLGYKYIFQSCLDLVREYILNSFDKKVDDRLDFLESKDTCVWACSECNKFDPEIFFVIIPDRVETPRHLEINFLNFHVRLPVPLDSFSIKIPEETLSDLRRTHGEHIRIAADCTDPQAEKLLGNVDYYYCVEERRMKLGLRIGTSQSEKQNGA
jgi:hypothetical protein